MKKTTNENAVQLKQSGEVTNFKPQYFFPRGIDRDEIVQLTQDFKLSDDLWLNEEDFVKVFKISIFQLEDYSRVTVFVEGNFELSGHVVKKGHGICISTENWPVSLEFPICEKEYELKLAGIRVDQPDPEEAKMWEHD